MKELIEKIKAPLTENPNLASEFRSQDGDSASVRLSFCAVG